jgi:hypothetical protein
MRITGSLVAFASVMAATWAGAQVRSRVEPSREPQGRTPPRADADIVGLFGYAVTAERPSNPAASACVIPWIRSRSKASRSTSSNSTIAQSMRSPSRLSAEALLAGAGTSPSRSSAADG